MFMGDIALAASSVMTAFLVVLTALAYHRSRLKGTLIVLLLAIAIVSLQLGLLLTVISGSTDPLRQRPLLTTVLIGGPIIPLVPLVLRRIRRSHRPHRPHPPAGEG